MKNIKVWHVIIMWIITIFCLCSCGAIKVDKIDTRIVDNSTIDTNIKMSEVITINDKDETTTTEEIIEPIDASKDAIYIDKLGIKQILYNVKKRSVTTVKNNNTVTEKKADKVEKVVEQKAVTQTTKEKHIDKKQFNLFQLLWLLIPILIIYGAYRTYKNLPLVPKT